jgi:hypothetical protein
VGEIGVGGSTGNIPGGVIGGVGVESNDNHGGKGRRIKAGRRNGGIGVDSSAEKEGTKDIAGEGFGGVVSWKERSDLGTEDEYEGLQGRFCGGGGSHIDMFLTSLIDRRKMDSSLTVHSHPLITLQSHSFMTCQHTILIDHSVKVSAGEIRATGEIRTTLCKGDRVGNKSVRFGKHDDDNDDDLTKRCPNLACRSNLACADFHTMIN